MPAAITPTPSSLSSSSDNDNDNDNDNDKDKDSDNHNDNHNDNGIDIDIDPTLAVSRPSLFTHAPLPRRSPLEHFHSPRAPYPPHPLALLDQLHLDHMRGFYNLSFLLLVFSFVYLFARSIVETGFLAGPTAICLAKLVRDVRVVSAFMLALPFVYTGAFVIVCAFARGYIGRSAVLAMYVVWAAVWLALGSVALFRVRLNPLFGVFLGLIYVVVGLKLHSWVLTNLLLAEETEERQKRKSVKKRRRKVNKEGDRGGGVGYPRNVRWSNFWYFVVAPVLVYETSYPRSSEVRWKYVAWYSVQAFVGLVVQYVLLMQFCVPVWRERERESAGVVWFWIKVALPSFGMWLLMFWGFFHCVLNVVAELTRFADRQFYREWWNATTLHQFWRMWNLLVHEWCLRHLYVVQVERRGMSARMAAMVTFVMSAVMHEYVCVVGFRMFRPYMFVGMVAQIPLMQYSERWEGMRLGNFLMWIMLFFGQSLIVLMYVRDFLSSRGTLMCNEKF